MELIKNITHLIESSPRFASLISGGLIALAFAPVYFFPFVVLFSVFAFLINRAKSYKEAFILGYAFGYGYFFVGLYWISIGVSVYAEKFWWAVPIALFLLPAFLALYISIFALAAFWGRGRFYINLFIVFWIIFELLRSHLFTGFPWLLVGYIFSFSDVIVQSSSIFGIYGLSIITLFSGLVFFYLLEHKIKLFISAFTILISVFIFLVSYGSSKLSNNPTEYSQVKIRLVQPSIKQTEKWSVEKFWENFDIHKDLSLNNIEEFKPDMIIWPEAAITIQPTYVQVFNAIKNIVYASKAILVTGGVTDNLGNKDRSRDKLFASIYAINDKAEMLFDYHKSHLVPFGEYVPLSKILPVEKLTPGSTPYDSGTPGFTVAVDELNLKIRPLLCYEIIFPSEVRMSNKDADVIFNLTNDAYYGRSSGPYQHFQMARVRSVENGLPLIRVANNGISAIVDPVGRILTKTSLDQTTYIDGYVPLKLKEETTYSKLGNLFVYIYILLSFVFFLFMQQKNK